MGHKQPKLWNKCEDSVIVNKASPKDIYLFAYHKDSELSLDMHIKGWSKDDASPLIKEKYREVQKKHMDEYIDLLTLSAKNGYTEAQITLSDIYSKRRIFKSKKYPHLDQPHLSHLYNLDKSFYWLEKAAILGDAQAQYNLSTLYRDKKFKKADSDKVFYWRLKSAKQGNPQAANAYSSDWGNVKPASELSLVLFYAWHLYYREANQSSKYPSPLSTYDLLLGMTMRSGGIKSIPDEIKNTAKALLPDIRNGQYNDIGITVTLQNLLKAKK
jgi:TPR repeat protein